MHIILFYMLAWVKNEWKQFCRLFPENSHTATEGYWLAPPPFNLFSSICLHPLQSLATGTWVITSLLVYEKKIFTVTHRLEISTP